MAELCSQFLVKGRKVYVEGRLSTRNWTGQDGSQKSTTEVVIDDMILLDNKQGGTAAQHSGSNEEPFDPEQGAEQPKPAAKRPAAKQEEAPSQPAKADEEVAPDDIPF